MTQDLIVAGSYLEVTNYRMEHGMGLAAHSITLPDQLKAYDGPKRAIGSRVKIHWVGSYRGLPNFAALELQARVQGFETPGL